MTSRWLVTPTGRTHARTECISAWQMGGLRFRNNRSRIVTCRRSCGTCLDWQHVLPSSSWHCASSRTRQLMPVTQRGAISAAAAALPSPGAPSPPAHPTAQVMGLCPQPLLTPSADA